MKHKLKVGDVMATGLSKPTNPQTSSNTRYDDFEDGQAVSANVSTSSSEVQNEKTSKETDEVSTQSENIGKLLFINILLLLFPFLSFFLCFVHIQEVNTYIVVIFAYP